MLRDVGNVVFYGRRLGLCSVFIVALGIWWQLETSFRGAFLLRAFELDNRVGRVLLVLLLVSRVRRKFEMISGWLVLDLLFHD